MITEPGLGLVMRGDDDASDAAKDLMRRVLCCTVDARVLWKIIDVDDGVESWSILRDGAGYATARVARRASSDAMKRTTWYGCGSVANLVEEFAWHRRVLAGHGKSPDKDIVADLCRAIRADGPARLQGLCRTWQNRLDRGQRVNAKAALDDLEKSARSLGLFHSLRHQPSNEEHNAKMPRRSKKKNNFFPQCLTEDDLAKVLLFVASPSNHPTEALRLIPTCRRVKRAVSRHLLTRLNLDIVPLSQGLYLLRSYARANAHLTHLALRTNHVERSLVVAWLVARCDVSRLSEIRLIDATYRGMGITWNAVTSTSSTVDVTGSALQDTATKSDFEKFVISKSSLAGGPHRRIDWLTPSKSFRP